MMTGAGSTSTTGAPTGSPIGPTWRIGARSTLPSTSLRQDGTRSRRRFERLGVPADVEALDEDVAGQRLDPIAEPIVMSDDLVSPMPDWHGVSFGLASVSRRDLVAATALSVQPLPGNRSPTIARGAHAALSHQRLACNEIHSPCPVHGLSKHRASFFFRS